jgi:hypothetical protein
MQGRLIWMLVLTACCTFSTEMAGQEKAKIAPNLDFIYQKHNDGNRVLSARLSVFQNRITYPITGQNILFSIGKDTISTIKTDNDGYAYLVIQPGAKLTKNKDGAYEFKTNFQGSDTLEPASGQLTYKDVILNMILEEKDSIRTVSIKLTELNEKGDSLPVAGQKVNTYVERMLSLLKISEESTDEHGMIRFEFPRDLPGESDGAIKVIAKLEDNEMFGNVEVKGSREWGIPVDHSIIEAHRALWTEIAPMWMIITLSILLTGVWGHYIYVIVQMIMVKKEANRAKQT